MGVIEGKLLGDNEGIVVVDGEKLGLGLGTIDGKLDGLDESDG